MQNLSESQSQNTPDPMNCFMFCHRSVHVIIIIHVCNDVVNVLSTFKHMIWAVERSRALD